MAARLEIFSAHSPWTASTQVARVVAANRQAVSPRVSSGCAQCYRRVCTEFPQGYAHRDWTPGGAHHKTVVATYYN
jgi:hypothetical protein